MRRLREAVTLKWRDINRAYPGAPYYGDTLLHVVCREGYLPMLRFMLSPTSRTIYETVELSVNATNVRGRTPLLLCFTPPHFTFSARAHGLALDPAAGLARAAAPSPEAIAAAGASGPEGLDWAAPGDPSDRQEMVRLLVEDGDADPDLQDFLGLSAVHYAAIWGWDATFRTLVDAGADAAAVTADGESCLHLAAAHGHVAAALSALDAVPRLLDCTDVAGRRAVHRAIVAGAAGSAGAGEVLALLGDEGADVNAPDFEGQTPLRLACEANVAALVLALLDAGAEAEEECLELLHGEAAQQV
ncbi:unnamed protein product, partial [Phaeothamnion confervicola]